MPSPIHAIIVGVNKYENQLIGTLSSAVQDATALKKCLLELVPGTNDSHIQLLTDEEATKKGIKKAIESLYFTIERNSPIVFFFSGFAARTSESGLICAHDAGVSNDGGFFTDRELQQLFEKTSRICGNNITLFLDCSADDFEWTNLTSMVVIAPNNARETPAGGAFTNALIEVLNKQKDNLDDLSVESFVHHVQAEITDAEVVIKATGTNVTRPIFNMKAQKSYHAFIPCHTSKDGRIILSAGAAHGVRVGAVYGVYRSNLRGRINRLGDLRVDSLNGDGLTATFEESALKIPSFFFACEEDNYIESIPIFCTNQVDLGSSAPWRLELDMAKAPIVVTTEQQGKVAFCWTGIYGGKASDFWPSLEVTQTDKVIEADKWPSLKCLISRSARFYHLLTLPTPLLNALSSKLRITFEEAESDGKNLLENDHFEPHKTLRLTHQSGNPNDVLGPYYLTLTNNHNHAVWVNLLFFNSEEFDIDIRYSTPRGSSKAPLEAGGKLVIGQNDRRAVMLSQRKHRQFDIWYIKVIVTKEQSDFTSLKQSSLFVPQLEADLRGYQNLKAAAQKDQVEGQSVQTALDDSESEEKLDEESRVSYWASSLITIAERFEPQESSGRTETALNGDDE